MSSLDELFIQKEEDAGNCQKLCGEYIGGPWVGLAADDFDCKIIPGGLCNRVFVCTNKKLIGKGTIEMPEKVLVRTYGSDFVGKRGDMIRVADAALPLIQQILYHHGLGPKIFGVFDEGRIEEYIENEKIDPKERHEMSYCEPIMRKIADAHNLQVPISKNPKSVLEMVKQWFKDGLDNTCLHNPGTIKPELDKYRVELAAFDWVTEVEWVERMIPLINSRQVFNHNDVQYANIFLRKTGSTIDDKIFLFDYENCSYGFRGYDVAFFLYAKSVDYFEPEFWTAVFWPEDDVVRHLVSVYREEHLKNLSSIDPIIDSLDHLMMEVEFFLLLVLLVRISVGYKKLGENFQEVLNYCHTTIERYHGRKRFFTEKYKELLKVMDDH